MKELMVSQNVGGEDEKWVEGYVRELETVGEKRLEEVFGEEAKEAMRTGYAMRLRMILERKKDGRHKGRLVGQGFLEPRRMTKGREDSPVASHSTIRAVFFGAGDESGQDDDLVGSIDVSTAFLQADLYKEGECKRYATFREYRGGPLRVFRLLGPLYGSRDSPRRWFILLRLSS